MSEIWKPIPGYEGLYEASSLGHIRGVNRIDSAGRKWRARELSPGKSTGGYLQVGLFKNGRPKYHYVHRLILLTFHGAAPTGTECRHIDGDPNNNAASNLRHGTRSENIRDQVTHGTHAFANKTHCPHGHAYTPENVVRRKGSRICRACINAAARRRYQVRRAYNINTKES